MRKMLGKTGVAQRLGVLRPNLMRDWGDRLPKPDAVTVRSSPLWFVETIEKWCRKEGL